MRAAIVLHVGSGNAAAGQEWGRGFNAKSGTRRQMWMADKDGLHTFESAKQCKSELGTSKCPYAGSGQQRPNMAK